MTAYGRADYKSGDLTFVSEIRSVNNRYRDVILRIPKNFQILDKHLRSIISSRIKRGRIEATVQIEDSGSETPYSLELNEPLVSSYIKIFNQLADQFGLDSEIRVEALCQIKDVVLIKPETLEVDKLRPGFEEVLRQALDSLDMMRIKEGEAIEADFVKRLQLLQQYTHNVAERAPDLVDEYRERLKENVERMTKDIAIDEGRIAQEVALFAEKSDITEEIVRIRSHLKQFQEYLLMDDALGRRLDFLIQEMNREVNTIGSKASDSSISLTVVEMKAELEKLREQAQNVE
jgi:uncharacterized protein (TIGR00255 family)